MQLIQDKRLFFIPQGPENSGAPDTLAVVKAMLLGYQIPVTETQLADALPKDTSADSPAALIHLAQKFGLTIEQALLPTDALHLSSALPALVMMRPIAEEPPHWAVVWNRVGPVFQVLDPQLGRLWM